MAYERAVANHLPCSYADKEFFYLSLMTDRFGWTSDDWDKLTPYARGNLIANLNYWANKKEKEMEKAQNQMKKE